MQELRMNGCLNATDAVLKPLNNADIPGSALSSLSLTACKYLRACWLGMEPASREEESAQQRLLAMGPHADAPVIDHQRSWRSLPTVLSGKQHWGFNPTAHLHPSNLWTRAVLPGLSHNHLAWLSKAKNV
jgi:hypothetical protein